MNNFLTTLCLIGSLALPAAIFAEDETLSLADLLQLISEMKITFSGHIAYDDDFTFYDDKDRNPFAVVMDAGRSARERVQDECENNSFSRQLSELCKIEGTGTIEIAGGRIILSIENITKLNK